MRTKLRPAAKLLGVLLAGAFWQAGIGGVGARTLPNDIVKVLKMNESTSEWTIYTKKFSELSLDPPTIKRMMDFEGLLDRYEYNPGTRFHLSHIRLWSEKVQLMQFRNDYGDVSVLDFANPVSQADQSLAFSNDTMGTNPALAFTASAQAAPQQVVKAFLNDSQNKAKIPSLLAPELSAELLQLLTRGSDFDPLSGRQNCCSIFRVGPMLISGDTAQVQIVMYFGNFMARKEIVNPTGNHDVRTAYLNKLNGLWKITDISYGKKSDWGQNTSMLKVLKEVNRNVSPH
jgi:hypothetical protein